MDGGLVGSNTTAGRAEWGGVPDAGQGAEVLGNAAPHQGDWFTTAETLGQANASGSGAPADMADWSLPNGSAAGNDPSATFNPFLKTPIAEQPAPLFRGERPSMGPETVFNDGLVPKGTNNDLFAHVSNNGAGSSFVSTSSSMDVARDFALSNGERASGWIYRINGQGAIDAAAATNNFRYTADQQEHVFRGPVEMSRVEAVAPVTREGGIGEFAPNPGFEAPSTLPATAANAARATAGGAAAGAAFAAADLALERAAAANFPGAQMAQHALRSDLAQTAAAIAFPASTIASGLSQQALDSMWPSTPGSWQDSAKRIVSGAAGGIGTVADSAAGFWTRPFTTGPAVSMVAPSGAAARANAAANGNESLALGAP
ncbi:MAG: hypothetical protein IPG50_28065 [Myxococcales bacterium]|nr:hypothetical protein [Myxococcales bacterium]